MAYHCKTNIWICFGLAVLGCVCPPCLQAGGARALEVKRLDNRANELRRQRERLSPPGFETRLQQIKKTQREPSLEEKIRGKRKSSGSFQEDFSAQDKRSLEEIRSRRKSSGRFQEGMDLISRDSGKLYSEKQGKLLERYTHDKEFQRRADEMAQKLVEQGIDKELLTYLPKHSMLDERSSVRFVANQFDEGIVFDRQLADIMKKIAKMVLREAVDNVPLFAFPQKSDWTSALKDAINKACDNLNGIKEPESLPWTLKLLESGGGLKKESDDLVFQSLNDELPSAKLSIGATLSTLTSPDNYEAIQTAPSEPAE
jgi:hypothetical protein